jgi:hypothetical protein
LKETLGQRNDRQWNKSQGRGSSDKNSPDNSAGEGLTPKQQPRTTPNKRTILVRSGFRVYRVFRGLKSVN